MRGRAWPRRSALALIAALAGVSYAWSANQDTLEIYYAAAVRSMSMSWHNFIFGAFDPAGTVTLDKLPGAFWLQALAVRAFGVHPWVIVAPQAIEGVLAVLVLYRAVARLAGPGAGLIAAVVLAASPAAVALDRGNISDSLMILLLVLAADAVSAAIAGRRPTGHLVLAGVWVGLAFQAKMTEAWMVLPALGLAYLLSGPGPAVRRVRQLIVAGVVAALLSLAWMTAVALVPPSSRPYVDGSHDDSIYQQVFVYNGFGRFSEQTPLQLLTGQVRPGEVLPIPPAAPNRLLRGNLGRDTGWLLPAALVVLLWGLFSRRGRPRTDPIRACLVLWGGWLVTLGVVFSAVTTINPYYTAALAPAVAAIVGAGVAAVWTAISTIRLAGLAVIVAGTAAYAAWLVPPGGVHVPGWLVPAIIAGGAVAVAMILVAALVLRRGVLFVVALAAAIAAVSVAPVVASAGLAANHEGALDTPFEPPKLAAAIDGTTRTLTQAKLVTVPRLENQANGTPYVLAAQTSGEASLFIFASGREALPIGGFTGTIPSPTLNQLQADIRANRFHLVLLIAATDPRLRWVAAHCARLGVRIYYCEPSDVG